MGTGVFALVAAAVAVASGAGGERSPEGRLAVPVGDRPVVATSAPLRLVDLGNNGPVDGLAWLRGGNLAVVTARDAVLHVLDPADRRTARWELHGEALAVTALSDAAVVLLAPVNREGRAWLAVVRPGLPPRLVRLPGVRAGWHRTGGFPYGPRAPALAVVGRRAIVFADRQALTVGLLDVRARRRPLPALGTSFGRSAVPLGHGVVAVAGRPGLAYVDTRTWRARRIAPHVTDVARWRGGVLAYSRTAVLGFDARGRRVYRRPARWYESVDVAPDGRHLVLTAFDRNGVTSVRTLDP